MCCGDWAVAPHGEGVRRLLFVLAVDREAAGRERAARVVHLTLVETARTGWRAPKGRREVLRSLASTIAATREGNPAPDFQPTDTLPEQLFIPSQPVPAMPGADAPEPGGPGSFSPPREPVPHPDMTEGESR